MLTLGYDVFPFAAYDQAGRVRIPDGVNYPTHVRDGLARVATSPAWTELYRALSVLDDPSWNAYMAGVGYGPKTLNVVVFKSVTSVPSAQAAQEWTVSYQTTLARSLRQFAGRRHPIDPKWLEYLDQALDRLETSAELAHDPAQPWTRPLTDEDGPAPTPGVEPLVAAPGWLLLGLRFLSGLFSRLVTTTEIRTTIVWFSPSSGPMLDMTFAGRWTPLHVDYMYDGSIRAVHATWEPRAKPHLIHGKGVPWDRWLWAMPHQPWQWCRAFYPTSNCGGPGLMQDAALALAESAPTGDSLPAVPDEHTDTRRPVTADGQE